jgi:hypothetical protein
MFRKFTSQSQLQLKFQCREFYYERHIFCFRHVEHRKHTRPRRQ